MLGTDFSLMESLFPRRTRFELKRKFKMEEKVNRQLIDKTISTQKPFDISVFGDESGVCLIRLSALTYCYSLILLIISS